MQMDFLQLLACPVCRSDLHFERIEEPVQDRRGTLKCASGCGSYPIDLGVPRLLPELGKKSLDPLDVQKTTGERFAGQWKLFEYGGTTWGISEKDRVEVALHELGWNEKELPGKIILDAGCGNGTLSAELARRGATVVGLDLSNSVFRARQQYRNRDLHFVQGNLFYPPFKPNRFDAIYSCGVFHHTPHTRTCFDNLVPLLKDDPHSRYFVWLYARRSALFNVTIEPLMKLTRRMPDRLLAALCLLGAPIVEVASRLLDRIGLQEDVPRSIRDRAIQLHDLLSPPFVWYHSFEEARNWASEAGFRRIDRTVYSGGSQMPERVRSVLENYRRVCRPGFGILCRDRVGEKRAA